MADIEQQRQSRNSGLVNWLFLGLATVLVVCLLMLLNDLRGEFRRTSQTVNEKLPEILDKTRKTADALAEVSADVRQLRDLAGIGSAPRDRTLAAYADAVLDSIEASGGTVGTKAMLGAELKNVITAREWSVAARKEALWLTFRAKSQSELLERLCETKFGSAWHIQLPDAQPVSLSEWIRAKHPPASDD